MTISEFKQFISKSLGVESLWKDPPPAHLSLCGLSGSSASIYLSALWKKAKNRPVVVIMDDEDEAGYFYHDLLQLHNDQDVLFFPSSYKRAIKYGQKDPGNEILRSTLLSRFVAGNSPRYVVTYPQALAEKVVHKEAFTTQTHQLALHDKYNMHELCETFLQAGFKKVDYVYEPGQLALRGSIMDIFSYASEYPYRIDFFDNEIDSIRTFDIQTQLSVEKQRSVVIIPDMKNGKEQSCSFLAFLPETSILVVKKGHFLLGEIKAIHEEGFAEQALVAAKEGADTDSPLDDVENVIVDPVSFQADYDRFPHLILSGSEVPSSKDAIVFKTRVQPIFHKNFDLLCQSFENFISDGYKIYLFSDSRKQAQRLKSIFEDRGTDIVFTHVDRAIHGGFVDDKLKICCFTDHQIFDRFHKYNLKSDKVKKGKVALSLKELQEFNVGDYVVHIDHGIGRFGGLIRIPNGDKWQEVIKITYKNEDAVFVSINSLHKISKYRGKDNEPPRISTLGTGAWERMKERTKTKIKDIARDLIRLYSIRRQGNGFAFSKDTFMQQELEASFLYEDTPDQLTATMQVKKDMESRRPMDRLVCGDVGFGKTEVAIRAAFKACVDDKQVAVLVPTTVLAYQHFHTFSERLKEFPVRVDYLTRARTPKQTKEILHDLQTGQINIIIGTHKLIGKKVKFHDLGLLIIDEEQKFGVSTKEKLRQMKTNVDTLTLTATPIPRTLQFSLMGARDLSVIQTPPPNRYPIQTQLCQFSPEVICEAINFEMSRNGQTFVVNNRISNLPELQSLIEKGVPDARVVYAHGQMPPSQLEQIMLDFANYEYDVLISTTIIESGLDIPNANTIIINAAQNYGLSDLHQMRGRVGRSNKKAFCFLLAPPLNALTAEARRRLEAIENFSDLGSGIQIAMQDLDIRGAGNMLGAEQSGFIAELGYETYQRILSESVHELKNEEFSELFENDAEQTGQDECVVECQVDTDIPMYFSEEYVPTSSERIILYRELDSMSTPEETALFKKRLVDRFGPIPKEGEELIRVVELRQLAKYFGAERIMLKHKKMRLFFVSNPENRFYKSHSFEQLIAYATLNIHACRLEENHGKRSMQILKITSVEQAVDRLRQIQQIKP